MVLSPILANIGQIYLVQFGTSLDVTKQVLKGTATLEECESGIQAFITC